MNKWSVLVLCLCSSVVFASESTPTSPPKKQGSNEMLRCIYTPAADQQSSSLPPLKLGFKFSLEPNNGNAIAADTYTLNDSMQMVKQVGHAELVMTSASTTEKLKVADLLAGLNLAEDSPFDFSVSLTQSSVTVGEPASWAGRVDTLTLFDGKRYAQLPVTCKVNAPPAK